MNCKPIAMAFAVTVLAACASTESADDSAARSAASAPATSGEGYCDSSVLQRYVGEAYSESTAQNAQSRAGARSLRVLQPGQVMTMEYNPTRLTIVVDDGGRIGSARCG